MDPIIRAMPLGGAPRPLSRVRSAPSGTTAAPSAPASPVLAVPPPAASTPAPAQADAGRVQALEEQRVREREQERAHDQARIRAELERESANRLEAELARLRDEARAQCERDREEARRAGFAAGQDQGAAEARAALRREVERAAAAADGLAEARGAVLAQAEDELVDLVFCAVTRLVGKAAGTRAQVMEHVRHLLQQARAGGPMTVRLHPDDAALLAGDACTVARFGPDIALRADADVLLGGCLIDSAQGRLDLRIETLLDQLRATLLAVRAVRAKEAQA